MHSGGHSLLRPSVRTLTSRGVAVISALGILSLTAGCSSGDRGGGAGETAQVSLAVTKAPEDALCLRLNVDGAKPQQRDFPLLPGQPTTFDVGGLPTGAVTFHAEAFGTGCSAVTASQVALYNSKEVDATLKPGRNPPVTLTMQANVASQVNVDFPTEVAVCGATDTACKSVEDCCSLDCAAPKEGMPSVCQAGTPVLAGEPITISRGKAELNIPEGALSADTEVSLSVGEPEKDDVERLRFPVSSGARVSFGKLDGVAGATLSIPLSNGNVDDEGLVVEWRNPGVATEKHPAVRILAAKRAGDHVVVNAKWRGTYTVLFFPKADEQQKIGSNDTPGIEPSIAEDGSYQPLQVPFYWQVGIPWCVPTSAAMYLNYFRTPEWLSGRADFPEGRAANYSIAGVNRQDRGVGYWPVDTLRNLGYPNSSFVTESWDVNVVHREAFRRYARLITDGFAIGGVSMSRRPLWMVSDRNAHAFVISGATESAVYFHNSNDYWSGMPAQGTWDSFYSVECALVDPMNADLGCSTDTGREIHSLVLLQAPRPETERRGSIDPPWLWGGEQRLFTFYAGDGGATGYFQWDGDPHARGYQIKDGFIVDGGAAVDTSRMPDDAEFGNAVPATASLATSLDIVNVTTSAHDYVVELDVTDTRTGATTRRVGSRNVAGYNRGRVDFPRVRLVDIFEGITQATVGQLRLTLRENGVIQDVKQYEFKVAPVASTPPSVRIVSPAPGSVVDLNTPVIVVAAPTDADDRTCCPLTWSPGPESVAGLGATYRFTAEGNATVTVTARDASGLTASASVNLLVVNRPPVPVITGPVRAYRGVPVAFSGSASDVNEAGGRLAPSRLAWSAQSPDSVLTVSGESTQVVFNQLGARELVLTGTDSQGIAATARLTVNVEPAPASNPPNVSIMSPVLNADFDDFETVTLSATASSDNPPLTQRWTITSYLADDVTPFVTNRSLGETLSMSFVPERLSPSILHLGACQRGQGQRVVAQIEVTDSQGLRSNVTRQFWIGCPPD